jgi:outer membrane lipoprotein-sorting protein
MKNILGFGSFEACSKVAVAVAAGVLFCASGHAQACDVTKTLAQMDAAALKFQSAQADFTWDQYQSVVQEHDTQSGTIYFSKHGGTTSMAADIRQPAAKYVTFDGSEVDFYTPSLNQETIMSAGNNKDQVETFLTLGFGGSGKDLQKNWDVTCAGTEVIDKVPTVKLELVAKQQSVRNTFSKVTIWVDPARAISLKQVFAEPSGDSRTDLFMNIKYNAPISPSVFRVKTKAGVQVTRK